MRWTRLTGRRPRRSGVAVVAAALAAAVSLAGCGGAQGAAGAGATSGPPRPASTHSGAPGATPAPSSAAQNQGSAAGSATGEGAKVVFVDVGQGDASIVRSGSWTGLIDGGPSGADGAVAAALKRLGVRRLDAVVVSHLHADHTGGLPDVVRAYRPRVVYLAGTLKGELKAAFSAAGSKVRQVRRGQTLPAWGAATAKVLSPGALADDPNQDSVVVLVQASGRRFLFTGDCTGPNEGAVASICARGPPVTVLKVAHHGSRYSTTSSFLTGVRPRTAVISVGPNSYGHPTAEALSRLRAAGATVYTTWKNGTITFTVNAGGGVKRSCTRSSRPVTGARDARAGAASQ